MDKPQLEKLEKKRRPGGDLSPEAELEMRRRHCRDGDRRVVDAISRRYGRHIRPERLDRARTQSPIFLDHKEFQDHLRRTGRTPESGESVMGYYDGQNIYVDLQNGVETTRTVAHERLHMLSDKQHRLSCDSRMHEGQTEYLMETMYPEVPIAGKGQSYEAELRVARMMAARAGTDAIAKAYFKGDTTDLEARLGDGKLAELTRLVEEKKYTDAEALIKRDHRGLEPIRGN